jgi:16S rRNA (cytidine1402-2'-O)-methyltransferase
MEETGRGTLYLCATPIGNLEDITFRAVRILKEAAVIAAEDTRHSRKLISHFDIHTPLVSYHEHNKEIRGPELIDRLLHGEDVVVISDAGVPGISDPGSHLVRLAVEAGIRVSPLPGANAALSALICSGLDTTVFTFVGFLPKTAKKRRAMLADLASCPHTLVFYEAPHRIRPVLAELKAALGDRPAVAARELTKKFEEFMRGTLESLSGYFEQHDPRGEFVLVVAGIPPGQALAAKAAEEDESAPVEAVMALVAAGENKKDAIKNVARRQGIQRRKLYQAVVEFEAGK